LQHFQNFLRKDKAGLADRFLFAILCSYLPKGYCLEDDLDTGKIITVFIRELLGDEYFDKYGW